MLPFKEIYQFDHFQQLFNLNFVKPFNLNGEQFDDDFIAHAYLKKIIN